MPHLIWTDNLNTGIEVIDTQHRRIIDFINILHDSRITSDRHVAEHVIDALIDYIISHFEFEEEMMEGAGYALTSPHMKDHESFIKSVDALRKRFKNGEEILDELQNLLTNWHFTHIREDDASYVNAVRPTIKNHIEHDSSWISNSIGRFFRSA